MTAREPAGTGTASDRALVPAARHWRDDALCAGIGDFLFFAGRGQENFTRVAKVICRQCPVSGPCLEYALEMEALPDTIGRHGVYGGTTTHERDLIARARKREAA